MVTRANIETANVAKSSGVIYTCNCGFFDLGHGNPQKAAWNVGATALWEQMVKEPARDALVDFYNNTPPGEAASVAPPGDPTARFPDGKPGFAVEYRQDMGTKVGGARLTFGVTRRYLVRRNLSLEQKKHVALAIFLEVTSGFEHMQGEFPWNLNSRSALSSFSIEDVVSDVIGFYIAVGEITQQNALAACHPCSVVASLALWDANPDAQKQKVQVPVPVLLAMKDTDGKPITECDGERRVFPNVFTRIPAAPKGTNFIDMPYAADPTGRRP